jgi:hypothetical protein
MIDLHLPGKAAIFLVALALPLASSAQVSANPPAPITVNAVFPPLSYLPFPGTQYASDFLTYVATSPLVDGINPPLLWSMVDKGPTNPGGQYDWTEFDAVIQPYIDLGKTVNLLVWSISNVGVNSDNYANHATPTYVMKLVDGVACPEFPGDGAPAGDNPIIWEAGFKDNYEKFITEVLRHYQGNPHIGYIRFGISGGAAIYPSCEGAQEKFLPAGETFEQALLDFDSDILSYVRSQNPTFPIIGPFAAFQNHFSYSQAEAANGIANGFGIGYQGLRNADIASYPNCTGDWCNLFNKYSTVQPKPPFELQTVGQSDPSATCTPSCWDGVQQQTGPLPQVLAFAVEHHTRVFEVYGNDLLLALDPNYPGYAEYHVQYQHALAAVHSGKGSALSISPTSLTFSKLKVGSSSAPQMLTLTYTGPNKLAFSGISIVGDFSETNDCQVLAPNQQCTVWVVFKPTATGKSGGLLKFADGDPWSPQTVGLTGTGE